MEFKVECNPHSDGPALLETFIEYVCYQLSVQFGLQCSRRDILDLESSTQQKFSRHLIFHLPGAVFRNNAHAGNFVHHICDKLRELKQASASDDSYQCTLDTNREKMSDFPVRPKGSGSQRWNSTLSPPAKDLLSLFVANEKGDCVLICDEGVYTRNRNFRLYRSSKLGKGTCLLVAKENRYKSSYSESTKNRRKTQLFNTLMDSLICNVRYDQRSCRVLEFESDRKSLKWRRSTKASTAASTMVSPLGDSEEGYSCSPYPRVDAFITSRLVHGGVQGSIRRWTYFPQGKMIVYDIQHNRWCENIGRAHKSNNIMIIADLVRGFYYQKCHDPECRRIDYRSQEYAVPVECNPVIQPQSGPQTQSQSPSCDISTCFTEDPTAAGGASVGDVALQELQLDLETASSLSEEDFLERVAAELDVPGETNEPAEACRKRMRIAEEEDTQSRTPTTATEVFKVATGRDVGVLGPAILGLEASQSSWLQRAGEEEDPSEQEGTCRGMVEPLKAKLMCGQGAGDGHKAEELDGEEYNALFNKVFDELEGCL